MEGFLNDLKKSKAGLTLIEVLVGVFIFVIIAVGLYQINVQVFRIITTVRLKTVAVALANEQFEIVRNLPFADIGVIGGIPAGVLEPTIIKERDGILFEINNAIRNIDDPFDGTIGGVPNDLSPADYKLVEIEVSCPACDGFNPLTFTSFVGPKGLETASGNGALFVRVYDANGQPVQGASIHIENNLENPPIVLDDTTNNDGLLQIIDAPPGTEAYEVTISKSGYSQDQTYPSGAPGNPNPILKHANVVSQWLTQISLFIDKTSTLEISSLTESCTPAADMDFTLLGVKLIGTQPDVLKYQEDLLTNGQGLLTLNNIEWDTYSFDFTDTVYDVIGSIPILPIVINPDTTVNVMLIVAPKDPLSLLVTVKDTSTQLPLSDATVTLEKDAFSTTLITGRGFLSQADWSGGPGQINYSNQTRFYSSDGNIEYNDPAGEIKLARGIIEYVSAGTLESSTFDTGSESNFHQIIWQPIDQPPEAGVDSVKFQIATNNDEATWNFLGPDGTGNTYYTLSENNIHSVHNGERYFRYKVFLETADNDFTPNLSDFAITYTSSCVPPGQVIFTGLAANQYDITISKDGYQIFQDSVDVNLPWQQTEVILSP